MLLYFILFVTQLILLYFISRISIRELFQVLRIFFSSDRIVFIFVSLIFLPGTIIHELAHFLAAISLMLRVHEVHVFPQWEKNYIKLGRVVYEKKDVIRSIFVGIAPVIVGLLFFWWFSAINVLSAEDIRIRIIMVYAIFVISTSMFSSKQDLIDIIYIIPFFLIVGAMIYIFQIDLSFIAKQDILISGFTKFLYDVNIFLAISLIIHTVIVGFFKLFQKIVRR